MNHPFHAYLSKNLADLLRKRCVVVFYDPRREFTPFIDELKADNEGASTGSVPLVRLGDLSAGLVRYQGSFFAIRAQVEPLVAEDRPEPLLIYVPGVERDRKGVPAAGHRASREPSLRPHREDLAAYAGRAEEAVELFWRDRRRLLGSEAAPTDRKPCVDGGRGCRDAQRQPRTQE